MRVQVSPSVFYKNNSLNNLPFDLEELIIVRSIVKYGSFRKASFQLGISQPSITLRVRILEKKIGRQIFLRKIPITLTESGIILYKYRSEEHTSELQSQR